MQGVRRRRDSHVRPGALPGAHQGRRIMQRPIIRYGAAIYPVVWILTLAFWGCSSDSDSGDAKRLSSAPTGAALAGSGAWDAADMQTAGASTNISFGGAQDIGFMRAQIEAGQVPTMEAMDAAGFFAEHHVELPPASCGERVCLQPMVAVMGNLMNGNNCTMLHLGLNSPIAADPGARPPLSLSVVVDTSGSMAGDKLAFVKEGLSLLIDGMRDGDELALVTYDDDAEVIAEMAEVGDQRVALRRAVNDLGADGSTNLSAGLIAGYEQVQQHFDQERQNRVILLSDGRPTVGNTATDTILSVSRGFNSEGIGLTTVGLGTDFNPELMRGLAEQADGNFYFLEDSSAVNEVFTEELSFFVVPVAFDLKLSVAAGPAYEFGRALGAPLWEDDGLGGFLDIPSVFLAHRESDKDVTEDDGRRGGGSSLLVELMPHEDAEHEAGATIATVELSYRDPTKEGVQHDTVELAYPHTPSRLLREGYFESENIESVQKSFVMLNIFVGIENAVMAFHSGSAGPETVGNLDNLIAAVEDYNEEQDDRDIELDLELLTQLRENLVQAGVDDDNAPVDDDPWPAD